ncbi:MarR family transcriptional regulator [Bosea sp. UNC402CLCol]|uniref:MarR family winged helix-turn-helix transcriptional regulator n=1 Tax=Bosea sp. UNC402CLCol TaxID=1510531 RepID=UPI0020BE446C|nr:MarR family transcriptional regulator [Bosea sp. UNC402CLCol]
MAATQLATEERLQPQSLTRILAGLEQEGLIVRARSDADRREILIALNDRGRRVLADDIHARRVWLENAIAAVLNEKERDLLFASSEAMLKLALHRSPGDEEAAE